MKNWSVTLFVVFVFFSVSGAYQYRNGSCSLLNQECTTDSECCSGNCRKYFSVFKKYCTDFSDHCLLLAGIKEIFMKPQYEMVTCVYDPASDSYRLGQQFGVAHGMFARYEPSTVMTVRRGFSTHNLVVDDRPPTVTNVTSAFSNGVLVLSEHPARELNIDPNATETCEIRVLVLNNHPLLKTTLYTAPAVGLFAGIYALVRYNMFV